MSWPTGDALMACLGPLYSTITRFSEASKLAIFAPAGLRLMSAVTELPLADLPLAEASAELRGQGVTGGPNQFADNRMNDDTGY